MTVLRFLVLVVVAILLAGLLTDPYTFARDGSDAIRNAPLWQLSFAILDGALLFAIVALAVRNKWRSTLVLLVIETTYYLAGNALLYLRDGTERFVHGLGAESNLGEHIIVVALRIVLVVYLAVTSRARALGRLTSA